MPHASRSATRGPWLSDFDDDVTPKSRRARRRSEEPIARTATAATAATAGTAGTANAPREPRKSRRRVGPSSCSASARSLPWEW